MSQSKQILHEDWAVVVLGLFVILLALVGVLLPVPATNWDAQEELFSKVLSGQNLLYLLLQFLFVGIISGAGIYLTGKSVKSFLIGFPTIYVLTIFALIIAGSPGVRALNLESVIISLTLGLIASNFFNLPAWLRASLSTELFVKIGLVLLGINVIFSDVLTAGSLGLLQALVVVIVVWYFAYWVCKKLKVDNELSLMLASSVSICGVSAAIATAGAIEGDPKKLSYVISMVLICAIPMMIFMPYIADYLGLSQEVTGAWLGGTIDTTGAVVASGSLVGETALKISTIVKFSQNVLLGIAAFAISIYWSYARPAAVAVAASGTATDGVQVAQPAVAPPVEKPTLKLIWARFPKFVLGFVIASLLFSFVISPELTNHVKGSIKNLQGLWFTLAFTCIGLETRFKDLFNYNNRKPLYAFLIAQGFNIIFTLIIAYFLFG